VAEKILDLGNFTVVALVFGQLVTQNRDSKIISFGIILTLASWIIGVLLLKERGVKHVH